MAQEWSAESWSRMEQAAGRRNLTLVLAHVALVRRLVEVLAVLQGGTHAWGEDVFRPGEERVAGDFFFFSSLMNYRYQTWVSWMVGVYSVKFLIGNCHRCIGIELWRGGCG